MPFTQVLPVWNAVGSAPPESKKSIGYLPDEHPPAGWWNWQMNLTYLALKDLQTNAADKTPVTTTVNGLMAASDKVKLNGIATGANNYVHPSTHPASMIVQDMNNRMLSDTQIQYLSEKADTTLATTAVNGLMSKEDKKYLEDLKVSPWISLTLQNGVKPYGSTSTPQYRKIGNVVYLRGAVTNVLSPDTVIATLPVGYRPTGQTHNYIQNGSNSGNPSVSQYIRFYINTTGEIAIFSASTPTQFEDGKWNPLHTSFPVD
ncbi:hypothetical protein [Peribacillus frigoritolerans]|uniref:hypothetical protein n=1 Tax=Peribacillus frigoritolerans TaxID=450367 RepID=UPI00227E3AA5|nr:hypothetical protein [Peribacillus frigoritolerans]MCY9007206.1 hypothetical protein [Peribacillus frigoritolerans]